MTTCKKPADICPCADELTKGWELSENREKNSTVQSNMSVLYQATVQGKFPCSLHEIPDQLGWRTSVMSSSGECKLG
ncbi:hypothetical protein N7465_000934 [Penicillium sp. CMV-2018d]|nr:hypothetical protein N7465_000934 [Penicillium sp. CMV-2018d]